LAIEAPQRVVKSVTQRADQSRGLLRQRRSSVLARFLPHTLAHEVVVTEQHVREGRFQRSLALIAGMSALLGGFEVTTEHYRGSYGQRIMYSPLVISPLLFLGGVFGAFNRRVARTLLPLSSLALLLDGAIGFIYHIRGIARKPGGWRIPLANIPMGPPLFAPLLLTIGGFLGLIATFLRREDDPLKARLTGQTVNLPRWARWLPKSLLREERSIAHEIREGRFQRILAGATAVSALLNGAESLYSHYENNFRYRMQWTPVLLSPVIFITGLGAIFSRRIARTVLPVVSMLAALDGLIGFFYHVRGSARKAGGTKKPIYNLIYGPPVFAPLLYAATGFLGILTSLLRRPR
jgi:hypothetical protein